MIFGGTAVQTVILAIITSRCDWEKEVSYLATPNFIKKYSKSIPLDQIKYLLQKFQEQRARMHLKKWAVAN